MFIKGLIFFILAGTTMAHAQNAQVVKTGASGVGHLAYVSEPEQLEIDKLDCVLSINAYTETHLTHNTPYPQTIDGKDSGFSASVGYSRGTNGLLFKISFADGEGTEIPNVPMPRYKELPQYAIFKNAQGDQAAVVCGLK